jgi:hypothetical protein
VTDDDRFDWLRKRAERAMPTERHLTTYWTIAGPTGKAITCELWEVATGLEVRAMREGELHRSELCRGPAAKDEACAIAEGWRRTLLDHGFLEKH